MGAPAEHWISRPKLRAEISLAGIRQDGEQAFSVAQLWSNEAAGVKNRSRGDSAKNPFLFRKATRSVSRIVVRNRDEAMNDILVEDFWNKSGADALNFVRTRLAAREHRRIRRFNGKQF